MGSLNSTTTLDSDTLTNNSALEGGGVYSQGGSVTVTNTTFFGDAAPVGGAVYSDGGTTSLVNDTITGSSGGNGSADGAVVGYPGGGGSITLSPIRCCPAIRVEVVRVHCRSMAVQRGRRRELWIRSRERLRLDDHWTARIGRQWFYWS